MELYQHQCSMSREKCSVIRKMLCHQKNVPCHQKNALYVLLYVTREMTPAARWTPRAQGRRRKDADAEKLHRKRRTPEKLICRSAVGGTKQTFSGIPLMEKNPRDRSKLCAKNRREKKRSVIKRSGSRKVVVWRLRRQMNSVEI